MSDKQAARRLVAQELYDYADDLNRRAFSRELGWQWFVGTRDTPDGRQHYLDRRDNRATAPRPAQTAFAGMRPDNQPDRSSNW